VVWSGVGVATLEKGAKLTTRFHQWREEAGWSLEEVAGLTGLSQSVLSRLERGQRNLRPATKVLVARRLGVSVGDLFEVEGVDRGVSR
jgi:transcriptional regulator with XRE-family HTH domain